MMTDTELADLKEDLANRASYARAAGLHAHTQTIMAQHDIVEAILEDSVLGLLIDIDSAIDFRTPPDATYTPLRFGPVGA